MFQKVARSKLADLAFDLPVGVVDRSYRPKFAAAEAGRVATVEVTVPDHLAPRVKSHPYRVAYDELLANQLGLLLTRANLRGTKGARGSQHRQAEGARGGRTALIAIGAESAPAMWKMPY